jgi:WD40 repeat protein
MQPSFGRKFFLAACLWGVADGLPAEEPNKDTVVQGTLVLDVNVKAEPNEVVVDSSDVGLRTLRPLILGVTFSADSTKLAATGGWENPTPVLAGEVSVWDLATKSRRLFVRQNSTIRNAAFSPDGKLIAWCDFSGVAQVMYADNGKVLTKAPRRGALCNSVQWAPDGTLVYIASWDGYIVMYDPNQKQAPTKIKAPDKSLATVTVTRDGAYLGAISHEGSAFIWDLGTFELLKQVSVNEGDPNGRGEAFAFSPDGKRFASGTYNGHLAIWNTESGELIRKLASAGPGQFKVQFTEDGKRLYSANGNGEITIWNTETGEVIKSAKVHADKTFAMALSPDEKWLATGSFDRSLKLLNPTTLEVIETLIKAPPPIEQ